jgi:hypothetical protein
LSGAFDSARGRRAPNRTNQDDNGNSRLPIQGY